MCRIFPVFIVGIIGIVAVGRIYFAVIVGILCFVNACALHVLVEEKGVSVVGMVGTVC